MHELDANSPLGRRRGRLIHAIQQVGRGEIFFFLCQIFPEDILRRHLLSCILCSSILQDGLSLVPHCAPSHRSPLARVISPPPANKIIKQPPRTRSLHSSPCHYFARADCVPPLCAACTRFARVFFFLQNLCLQPRRPYSVGRCLSRSTSYFFLFVSFPALRALASFPFALCATHLHPPQRVWFCGRPNLIYCCCDLSFLAFHSSGHLHPDPTSPPVSLPDHPTAPCLLHTATPHCVFSCFAAHSQAARKPFLLLTHG